MDSSVNILNWFEISVSDITRARKFYETIFSIRMMETDMMGMKMAFFPMENANGKVSGGLVQSPLHKPGRNGAIIYFNANPDLDEALSKVEAAGGRIDIPKGRISDEIGYMAFFTDTEGNALAMHSNN
jgi:uncharacterized protein